MSRELKDYSNPNTQKIIDNTLKTIDGINEYTIRPTIRYGDSVTGDTPLLLKNKNSDMITLKTIESLSSYENFEWFEYPGFKPFSKDIKNKEQSLTNFQVWTNNKWSNIKRVIRHKTNKNIYRINTHNGVVDVTQDHSLIDENMKLIKPTECNSNTKLLQSYPDIINKDIANNKVYKLEEILDNIHNFNLKNKSNDELEAYVYGFFYGDGSCGQYDSKWSKKYSWALNNKDLNILNKLKQILEKIYDSEFKINNTINSSGAYKLVPIGNIKKMVSIFRPIFYDKHKYKIVPDKILNGNYQVRLNFFLGYYEADGAKCYNEKGKCIRFSNKGKIGSAQLYYIVKSLGYNASISIRNDKPDIYRITCCSPSSKQRVINNKIKKNILIRNVNDDDEYVYDLETEEGIFNAGIGEIIVKNTDSVFTDFRFYKNNKEIEIEKSKVIFEKNVRFRW